MVIMKHLNHHKVLISKLESLVVYDVNTDTTVDVDLPVLTIAQGENKLITDIATSKCGNYFAILRNKQIVIYTDNLKVIREFTLKRAAHSITIFGNCNILIADKTGDVYRFKLDDEDVNGLFLLGHLSMLLDVVMTDNEKFLITCDRDEKIRVSNYPNTYNIEQFCLGHNEFISKLLLLENPYLLSASGDGKVIVWNYLKGIIQHVINTTDYVNDKTVVNAFVERMEKDKCQVTCLPIIDMQITKKLDSFYNIVIQIYKLKYLQVYSLSTENNIFDSKFIENIYLPSEIETFSLNRQLFVSTKQEISMFTIKDNKFIKEHRNNLEKVVAAEDHGDYDISVLYKRKFDNVQEYLERKRQRMEGK